MTLKMLLSWHIEQRQLALARAARGRSSPEAVLHHEAIRLLDDMLNQFETWVK